MCAILRLLSIFYFNKNNFLDIGFFPTLFIFSFLSFQVFCDKNVDMIVYSLLLLILYDFLPKVVTFDTVCIGLCHCVGNVVDCSSLDLSEIPTTIPNNTRILLLSDNEIESIDKSRLKGFYFLQTL